MRRPARGRGATAGKLQGSAGLSVTREAAQCGGARSARRSRFWDRAEGPRTGLILVIMGGIADRILFLECAGLAGWGGVVVESPAAVGGCR